jgi:purine-cytosine permease-like protein
MARKPVPRNILLLLTALGLVLPIALTVILGVAAVLTAMKDPEGSEVLRWIGLGLGLIWVVDLLSLVLAQGINSLQNEDDREDTDNRS